MVKVIPGSRRELLANSEVFEIVTKYQNEEKERAKKSRKPLKAGLYLNLYFITNWTTPTPK